MSKISGCPADGIIEAASTWLIQLRNDNVPTADKAAFTDWLLQSSSHIREFMWCDQVWSWLQGVDWDKVRAAEEVSRVGAAPDKPDPPH